MYYTLINVHNFEFRMHSSSLVTVSNCIHHIITASTQHTLGVLPPGDAKLEGAPFWLEGLDLEVVVAIRHQFLHNLCILAISRIVVTDLDHLGPVVRAKQGYNHVAVTVSQDGVLGTRVLVGVEANEEFCTCT